MKQIVTAPIFAFSALGGLLTSFAFQFDPVFVTLLGLMGLDVVSGLLAACKAHEVSSNVSYTGLRKKAMIVCLVASAQLLGWGLHQTHGIPLNLGGLLAGAFCVYELVSIVENAGRVGLPIPEPLMSVLARLQQVTGKGGV